MPSSATSRLLLLLAVAVKAAIGAEAPLSIPSILDTYAAGYQQVASARLSTLHWGREVSIWINRDAGRYRQGVRQGAAERAGEEAGAFAKYADGTVLVKEQRLTGGGSGAGWSIMIRDSSKAAPFGGPWRYIEVDADRRVLLDGTGADPQVAARCAICHQQISARDFLFHNFADQAPGAP